MKVFAVINIVDGVPTACYCYPGDYRKAVDCAMEMIWEQTTDDGDRNIDLSKFIANNKAKFTKHFDNNISYSVCTNTNVSVINMG